MRLNSTDKTKSDKDTVGAIFKSETATNLVTFTTHIVINVGNKILRDISSR